MKSQTLLRRDIYFALRGRQHEFQYLAAVLFIY